MKKKKVILIAVVSALLLVLAAGLALAVTEDCTSDPCSGTTAGDNLFEQSGLTDDFIQGLAGRDFIDASEFGGVGDADNLRGNAGNDVLYTADLDDNDTASGGSGKDVCIVDAGDNANCERVETRP
jgi:RTX calcium-binding nonapeptide repeat (4 copies)